MAGHQPSKPSGAKPFKAPVWHQPDGSPVSCVEKIKVLNQNLTELQQMAQDLVEDAVLMGCDEAQIRTVLDHMIGNLKNPYRKS